MSPPDIVSQNQLDDIAVRAGWLLPAERNEAGVLTYKHSELKLDLIVRSGFRPHDKRRDFYMVTFSDPAFVAWLVQNMREADYGYYIGGGLFMMLGLKLELFLSDSAHFRRKLDVSGVRTLIPFGFVHPAYLEGAP